MMHKCEELLPRSIEDCTVVGHKISLVSSAQTPSGWRGIWPDPWLYTKRPGEVTMPPFSPEQAREFGRRGGVAIVSTLDIMPIVYLQPGQVVLKTVLRRGEALKPGTRIVEVYL
jgi:hypothetical protein